MLASANKSQVRSSVVSHLAVIQNSQSFLTNTVTCMPGTCIPVTAVNSIVELAGCISRINNEMFHHNLVSKSPDLCKKYDMQTDGCMYVWTDWLPTISPETDTR